MKTKPGDADVSQYLDSIEHPGRREDARVLLDLMREASGEEPVLWGTSIIGYGNYHYRYDSGHEGDFFLTGFAPRKANMVVYIMPGYTDYSHLLEKLGKHRIGKSCLYLGRLKSVDLDVLREIVEHSVQYMREKYN